MALRTPLFAGGVTGVAVVCDSGCRGALRMLSTVVMLTMIDTEGIMRIAIWLLGTAALIYGLAVAVFGVVALIGQFTSSTAIISVTGATGYVDFVQFGETDISYQGSWDTATLTIQGAPLGPLLLHLSSGVCVVLVHLALASAALILGRALLRGRPFDAIVARALEISVLALLGFGLLAQGLDWAGDVTLLDYLGDHAFSRAFTFDPLVITGALALSLVAVAFRVGTRMQRDTEGLV